jgi:hypothetical protein
MEKEQQIQHKSSRKKGFKVIKMRKYWEKQGSEAYPDKRNGEGGIRTRGKILLLRRFSKAGILTAMR